jgi:curved DNA-binding protein CbpA
MTETYYDILDISENASEDEIEKAYRNQVKENHPDVSSAPDATERFKQIQTAYNVLSDVNKRARYDRLGHSQFVSMQNGAVSQSSSTKNGDKSQSSDRRKQRSSDSVDHSPSGPGRVDWATTSPYNCGSSTTRATVGLGIATLGPFLSIIASVVLWFVIPPLALNWSPAIKLLAVGVTVIAITAFSILASEYIIGTDRRFLTALGIR